eukprot:1156966-Pelagomonas_calceolata.AAC.4
MSGPDFAAEQGCGFVSVNNVGSGCHSAERRACICPILRGDKCNDKLDVKSAVVDAEVLPNTEHTGDDMVTRPCLLLLRLVVRAAAHLPLYSTAMDVHPSQKLILSSRRMAVAVHCQSLYFSLKVLRASLSQRRQVWQKSKPESWGFQSRVTVTSTLRWVRGSPGPMNWADLPLMIARALVIALASHDCSHANVKGIHGKKRKEKKNYVG